MKKFLFPLMLSTLFTQMASADIIRCSFTEPFASTIYSMTQQSLTIHAPEEKVRVLRNVSFQIKGTGQFELVARNGKVLQKLDLNNRGSDGMSDTVYPYDVMDSVIRQGQTLRGGCVSNYLKSQNPNN